MILADFIPVGSVLSSMLTESQFQDQAGAGWVLADGRNVSGSAYSTVTGSSTIPDLRGIYLRGKNNSRSDGNQDPAGEQALGTYEADQNVSHTHSMDPTHSALEAFAGGGSTRTIVMATTASSTTAQTDVVFGANVTGATGAADARPRSVVVNHFIKIN